MKGNLVASVLRRDFVLLVLNRQRRNRAHLRVVREGGERERKGGKEGKKEWKGGKKGDREGKREGGREKVGE